MAETLRELVVALSLDSSNFSRNMRTINQQIKEAESTFRLAGAGVQNYPHWQRHQLQPHHCRCTGHNAGVRGQRLQRLAGGEDRKPGRMGFRGVRRDHNRINDHGVLPSGRAPAFFMSGPEN